MPEVTLARRGAKGSPKIVCPAALAAIVPPVCLNVAVTKRPILVYVASKVGEVHVVKLPLVGVQVPSS